MTKLKRTSIEQQVWEQYGDTPRDYLMRIMRNDDASQDLRFAAAVACLPYVHAKLKQVEVNDQREIRRPEEIQRDRDRFIAQVLDARERGDLLGDVRGAGVSTVH